MFLRDAAHLITPPDIGPRQMSRHQKSRLVLMIPDDCLIRTKTQSPNQPGNPPNLVMHRDIADHPFQSIQFTLSDLTDPFSAL